MSERPGGVRDVISCQRTTRWTGSKMRPLERVWYVCTLSCGHVVEKRKEKAEPPKRLKCFECLDLLDVKR